ncbi:MAG: zinc-ribbon domain-containing protein [Deltaproteobacteria bacterium]
MSDELRVACPHCGSRFRLKNRQSLGRKMTCRNCGDEFTARTSTGDDEFAAEDDLLPAPARRSSDGSRRKKSGRWRMRPP